MKRYALKRDAVRRHLLSDEETAAARRALLLLAGHRNVNVTSHADPRDAPPNHAPGDGVGAPFEALQLLEADPP